MSIKRLGLVAMSMLVAHSLGLGFFDPAQGISRIWPASGVAVAALALSPKRAATAVLATVFATAALINLIAGIPPWVSFGFATANVLECSIAVGVARKVSPAPFWTGGVRDMLALICGAGLAVIVSGLVGASITSFAGLSAFAVAYHTWTIADFLGILLIVPLAANWRRPKPAFTHTGRRRELAAFSLAWIGVAALAFLRPRLLGGWNVDPYMLLPLLAWAALRFGQREVSTALAVLAVLAVIGTAHGVGAFGSGGGATERLLATQLYLGIASLSGLLLAATQAERRAAELEAREGQARLRALGDNLPDGMVYQVVREPDGKMRFVYVSRGVERMHGVTPDAVLADPSLLYEQIEPADRDVVAKAEEESMQTLQPFRTLARLRNTNGEIRSMALASSPRRLSDGRTLWDGVETDVTELRRAEDESLRAAERLKLALEAVRMGTWEWDIVTGSVFWSEHVAPLFGVAPGTFDGTYAAYMDLLHPEDRERVAQLMERVLRGESDDFEFEHRTAPREGATRWLAGRGRVYRDESGRPLRMAGTVVDVTDRKAAQDAVRRSEDQLRQVQKLEALGTLAGGIAHDFNNILGAIIAHAELARLERAGDAGLDEHVEQILTAASRAASLVQKILSFSRKQAQQRARIVLCDVITEALGLLRATLPVTIQIEEHVDAALPPVFADPTQLLQVVMNLCTNAAHAMNNRGKLGVRVERCTLPGESLVPNAELPPGQYARLSVTDTGHGMDQETISRIFDPFFTTKEPGAGTGLGLAVVFGIVKDHEGAITVTSAPGKGATFTVYLPLMKTDVVAPTASTGEPAQGHGELILFVDDEQILCDVGRNLLARAGYRVETFKSSSAAWATLEEDPARFAAVVTDLTMPGLTGLELAARISKLQPTLPVIVATGFLDGNSAATIAGVPVHQVLTKPYGYGALTSAVASALESRR